MLKCQCQNKHEVLIEETVLYAPSVGNGIGSFSEKEAEFRSRVLIHLSHEMGTRPCQDWNEAL